MSRREDGRPVKDPCPMDEKTHLRTRSAAKRPGAARRWLFFAPLSLLLRSYFALARRLSPKKAAALARALSGKLHTLAAPRRAANARAVLDPSTDVQGLEKAWRAYHDRLLAEMARQPFQSPEEFMSPIAFEGERHLQEALAAGKGAFIAGSHWGRWYQAPAALALSGRRPACALYDMPLSSLNRQFRLSARRFGWTPVNVGEGVPRAARRAFDDNWVMMAYFDATVRPARSAWLPLGRGEIRVDTGSARLALLGQGPILYMSCEMLDDGGCRIRFTPVDRPGGPKAGRPEALTRAWLALLEKDVARRPDHWWSLGFAPLREKTRG